MGSCFSTGEYLSIPSTQAGALEVAGEADSELSNRFPSSGSHPPPTRFESTASFRSPFLSISLLLVGQK